jgi:2-polyprenyl-3-methyl-5-hydroxy-6-metoxy-1,4-benzoquinol methylase
MRAILLAVALGGAAVAAWRAWWRRRLAQSSWGSVAVEYEQRIEPFTAQFVPELLTKAGRLQGKSLLDTACGTGAVALYASAQGARCCACDVAESMVERAAQRVALDEAVVANGMALPATWTDRFDVVVSSCT